MKTNNKTNREKARDLINGKVFSVMGISLDDLPDTYRLCNMLDDIQEILDDELDTDRQERINEILDEIDEDFIKYEIFESF